MFVLWAVCTFNLLAVESVYFVFGGMWLCLLLSIVWPCVEALRLQRTQKVISLAEGDPVDFIDAGLLLPGCSETA